MATSNPYQYELQRTISQNGANGLPEKDMFGKPWGGGAPKPAAAVVPPAPTSNTMPVRDPLSGANAPPPAANLPLSPMPAVPTTYTGFTPKHDYSAFDTAREQNTGKSAKDAFAYLSNQAPPPPMHDKAALGAWFTQYIKPGMDALGHNVSSVDGDKFRFKNWQGEYDVDFIENAGAAPGSMRQRLQFGAENAGGVPQTQGAYQPMGATQQQGSVMPGQSDLMAQILESLQNQQQQPDSQALLMQQLR